jgi:hypothetical protein
MEYPWLKFLNTVLLQDFENLLNEYRRLREMFQENNIAKSQLQKGVGLSTEMYLQRDLLLRLIEKLNKSLLKYGMLDDKSRQEFSTYLSQKLSIIDSETPLKD